MHYVFVLDSKRKQLMPCHPARARTLLKKGKAAVFHHIPFTIILNEKKNSVVQPVELKLDPGSKTTGIAVVVEGLCGRKAVWAGEINHRGRAIRDALFSRRQLRRGRRNRHTRYRPPRFDNRLKGRGWLAPSLHSRVNNCLTWALRLQRLVPIISISVETVRFDTQAMQNPEISGVEYQQGELAGYEIREYLLEKFDRRCVYCGIGQQPLQIEHVVPRARGGSDRVSNLVIACRACNETKGTRDIREFLTGQPEVLTSLLYRLKTPLKDAAAVNATRYVIGNGLLSLGLPVSFWSGGRTKCNRISQGYRKTHWLDAVCVGESGSHVYVPQSLQPLTITATGRGSRQMCGMDRFGFPRTSAKKSRSVYGFRTGDLVKVVIPVGKKTGTYFGRVAVRTSGSFNVKTKAGTVQGVSWKYCTKLHSADGYNYHIGSSVSYAT